MGFVPTFQRDLASQGKSDGLAEASMSDNIELYKDPGMHSRLEVKPRYSAAYFWQTW